MGEMLLGEKKQKEIYGKLERFNWGLRGEGRGGGYGGRARGGQVASIATMAYSSPKSELLFVECFHPAFTPALVLIS